MHSSGMDQLAQNPRNTADRSKAFHKLTGIRLHAVYIYGEDENWMLAQGLVCFEPDNIRR